jgi:hypothetical protein
VADRRYYQPSRHGLEARVAERAERIRAILDQAGQTDRAEQADKTGQTGRAGQADKAGQAGKEQP